MDSFIADLRYAARSLSKRPGFTSLAVLTLGLGIGVSTVAFNAVSGMLLRPFRVLDAERLGWVMLTGPGNQRGYATSSEFAAVARDARALDAIEAEARVPVSLRTSGGAEPAWALAVSTNYLRTFSVPMQQGRAFDSRDVEGGIPVVVSERFWNDKLGRPTSLGGVTINVSGRVLSVVGVVDDGFQGPGGLFAPDMWLPLERLDALPLARHDAQDAWLTLFGRLAPGGTVAQAEGELTSIVKATMPNGDAARARRALFHRMKDGHPDLREIRPLAWLAFAAVNVVLLIACFNLSSLLIARSTERQGEISVRTALGASRRRIVQQLLTESMLLAACAGLASLAVAAWSESLLSTFSLPAPIPQRLHLGINWMVVLFTAVATLVAGALPALISAWRATGQGRVASVRTDVLFASRSHLRSAFVIAQVTGSTAFLVTAALFVRSFSYLGDVHPGFDHQHLALLQVTPSEHGYSREAAANLVSRLEQNVRQLPGVTQAAVADRVPFYVGTTTSITYSSGERGCRGADCPSAGLYAVGSGYFAAMAVPIVEGREFSSHDLQARGAVIVSDAFARKVWPGGSALGRRLYIGEEGQLAEVIGVAADMKHRNLAELAAPYVFRPLHAGDLDAGVVVVARMGGDPRTLLNPVREVVRALDPNLPPATLTTMTERMQLPLWPSRTAAGFFLICGTLALTLATIGLFGVLYFTVAQRTREFGIRVAIGASRQRILRSVLGEGVRLAVPGIVLGLLLGLGAGRLLSRMLFGVGPADPVSLVVTACVELAVVLAASALPAYRATTADPIEALRQQ